MHKKQAISMVSSSLAGAKTARACDGCVGKKAGWYCPADDAFLCQNCDRSVHSANSLAGRHQRVRLECSSRPSSWDCGFTRKARTPRNRKKNSKDCPTLIKEFIHDSYSADVKHALHLVPEVYSISDEEKEEEEELLYCVPILDPSVAEMCSSGGGANFPASRECHYEEGSEVIRPSEFATEVVESLLGIGFEEEEPMGTVEVLGLLSNFNQGNHNNVGGDEGGDFVANDDFGSENGRKKTLLKLDYEGVITAWADQRSPWSNGERPDLDLNDGWLDLMGEGRDGYGEMGGGLMEEGRKARVWRYREKRRKRLFSKRIRCQVRKLNAEKRPRMKGRFVKRPNCVPPPPLSFPLQIS